jgi:hypothetical protein
LASTTSFPAAPVTPILDQWGDPWPTAKPTVAWGKRSAAPGKRQRNAPLAESQTHSPNVGNEVGLQPTNNKAFKNDNLSRRHVVATMNKPLKHNNLQRFPY